MADTYREQCDCGCGDEVGDETEEVADFYARAAAEHSTVTVPDYGWPLRKMRRISRRWTHRFKGGQ